MRRVKKAEFVSGHLKKNQSHQNAENREYSGTALLFQAEEDIPRYNRWIVKQVIDATGKKPGLRVLDFGAGVGTLSQIFATQAGVTPDCIELDRENQATIASRGFRCYQEIHELQDKYSLVYSSNVFEHIPDDSAVANELRDHMLDGAKLVIFVPALPLLWSKMDSRVGHIRRYTKKSMRQMLEKSGFDVISMRYCNSVGFALTLLFKLVGSSSGEPSRTALRIFDKFLLPISRVFDFLLLGSLGQNLFVVADLKPDTR